MAIVVKHDRGPASLGGIATAIGQGQAATRNAALDEDRARFLLGLREHRREFDVNTALRVRGEDIDQRRYATNLALQDSRQQQLNQNAELNRQAQLQSQAMREESDIYQQQQAQQFAYQAQAAKSLEEQVFEMEKAAQQLKLNPEGQRILNERIGALRKVREARAQARPDVYANLLGQWMSDYEQANLSAYEVQEPTAQQKVYDGLVPLQGQQIVPGQPLPPGTYRSLKGTRNGVDSWETITIPKEDTQTTAERWTRDSVDSPDGGRAVWNPEKETWTHFPPAKPEKVEKPKEIDNSKLRSAAIADLRAEYQLLPEPENGKKPAFRPTTAEILAKALELESIDNQIEAARAKAAAGGAKGDAAITTLPSQPSYDPMDAMVPDWDGMTGRPPEPVSVSTMEEASRVEKGGTFIYNGQTFLVTGPGEAEPL